MPTAFVQVPAFNEGPAMIPVLEQIRDQEPPEGWDVEREVWVTLSPPDKELCDTWQSAVATRGFEVHEAPRGKLSARNAAHDHAVARDADVIVTWDADAPPIHDETLENLLQPFEQPGIAAVSGGVRAPKTGLGTLVNLAGGVDDRVRPHLHGQLSAFTAEAWEAAGPFDVDVDEQLVDEVRAEEEFAFRERLAQAGEVVDARDAAVANDTRRWECRLDDAVRSVTRQKGNGYCDRRGVTTFAQRGRRR